LPRHELADLEATLTCRGTCGPSWLGVDGRCVKQARAFLNTHDSTRRLIERKRFEEGYAGSSSEATEYLVEICVMTVGVDCLSVEPFEDEKFKAWRILFGAVVKPSVYSFFACVQPKYAVSDGVPARATLVSDLQGGSAA
jgi:kynurenine formamidase